MRISDFWNIMLATDSYKASHTKMYPDGMTYMESYFESRGGDYSSTMFFGLQYYIKSFLLGQQVTLEKIQEAEQFYALHFGIDNVFDKKMWLHVLNAHGGKLPIRIEAVREGSIVPTSNVLFKISNTDPKCAKLVNWVETLLMKMWYPITIASNSMVGHEILEFYRKVCSQQPHINFSLHDFGYRGVTSEEQAWIGGAAHLLNFRGTDTIAGIRMLQKYYGAPMCGYSVPATEHSVMCANGKEYEEETYIKILELYPTGVVSIVSDTWDVYNVCRFVANNPRLRKLILERKGKVVLRPDSGEPIEVILKCLEILEAGFGTTEFTRCFDVKGNVVAKDSPDFHIEKTYKTINEKIGLIQGDGIDIYSMANICKILEQKGWSIDNLVFGSGGGLLQKVNRDTIKAAIKASYIEVNGVGMDIQKDPITAKGSKKSKRGRQFLGHNEGGYYTFSAQLKSSERHPDDILQIIYSDGDLVQETTYDAILLQIESDMNILNMQAA